jgi:hypothetical protein
MGYNNGLVIQRQQRGNLKWWLSNQYAAMYWPGNGVFTGANIYPDVEFHITSTYTPAGINEFSALNTEVKLYPNPANSTATLSYNLKSHAQVNISINDLAGKQIMKIIQPDAVGLQHVSLNTGNLTSGIYFVTLNAGNASKTMKLVIAQ